MSAGTKQSGCVRARRSSPLDHARCMNEKALQSPCGDCPPRHSAALIEMNGVHLGPQHSAALGHRKVGKSVCRTVVTELLVQGGASPWHRRGTDASRSKGPSGDPPGRQNRQNLDLTTLFDNMQDQSGSSTSDSIPVGATRNLLILYGFFARFAAASALNLTAV